MTRKLIEITIQSKFKYFFFPAVFLCFYVSQLASNWVFIRYFGFRGERNFEDLYSILESSQCKGPHCFFPYGSTLRLFLENISIPLSSSNIIGYVFILGTCIALTAVSKSRTSTVNHLYFSLLCIFLFCSPPILLLLERGNFDIVMVWLVLLSSYYIWKDNIFLGISFLLIASLFKFYTVALLIIPIFIAKKNSLKIYGIGSIIVSLLGTILNQTQLNFASRTGAFASFGAPVYATYLKKLNIHDIQIYFPGPILGDLLLLLGIIFLSISVKKNSKRKFGFTSQEHQRKNWGYLVFTFAFLTHLTCFILSNNFDYRMVYLLIAVVSYVGIKGFRQKSTLIIVALTLVATWCSFEIYSLQPVGNLSVLLVTILLMMPFVEDTKTQEFIDRINLAFRKKILHSD